MSPSYSWQFEIISWQFLLCVHRQMERKILFQRRNERVLMKKMAAKKRVMKIPITKVLQMVTKTVFLYHFGAFVFLVVPYILALPLIIRTRLYLFYLHLLEITSRKWQITIHVARLTLLFLLWRHISMGICRNFF